MVIQDNSFLSFCIGLGCQLKDFFDGKVKQPAELEQFLYLEVLDLVDQPAEALALDADVGRYYIPRDEVKYI